MARKKQTDGNAKASLEDAATKRYSVTLDTDLTRKAGVIASALGISVPDYVNNRLRPIIEKELPKVLRTLGIKVEG